MMKWLLLGILIFTVYVSTIWYPSRDEYILDIFRMGKSWVLANLPASQKFMLAGYKYKNV